MADPFRRLLARMRAVSNAARQYGDPAHLAHFASRARSKFFHPRDQRLPDAAWDGFKVAAFHPGVVHPTRVVMTELRLKQLRDAGVGSGVHEAYQAWIRVRRHLRSPVSNSTAFRSPMYQRPLHLLSDIEVMACRVALWLGVSEIREQKPYWPWNHIHPIAGWDPLRDLSAPEVPGSIQIASELGLKHGYYPGTSIYFVGTTDLMLRVGYPPNDRLVLWACKPHDFLQNRTPEFGRMHERLEIEKTYARYISAHWTTFTDKTIGEKLGRNLALFEPTRTQLLAAQASSQFDDFVGYFEEWATSGLPIRDCVALSAQKVSTTKAHGFDLFHLGAWSGLIDVDLSVDVLTTKPVQRADRATIADLRRALLGTDAYA